MLTTKRINSGISTLSRILRVVIILYSASLLANCVWWVLSPANTDIFVQQPVLDVTDKSTTYINNNSPFGVIVVKSTVKEKPGITELVKLTGIYLNTNKDSFAFLEYKSKPIVVRMGEKIADSGAIIKSISATSIVVNAESQDVTIRITQGGATASASPAAGSSRNSPATMFGGDNTNSFNNLNNNDNSSVAHRQNMEDFNQRRKKALEDYSSRMNTTNVDKTRENPSNPDDRARENPSNPGHE